MPKVARAWLAVASAVDGGAPRAPMIELRSDGARGALERLASFVTA
jgi:hypothetical protein